jgi:ABC-2 type transport system ATP-binding protein
MNTDHSIQTQDLGKRYGRRWALRNCELTVPKGSVVALVGPNGAGKTTLLRLVVGLMAPTEGSVEVFGQSPATNTPQALARVGFVAQEHPLYRRFSVADLLHLGRSLNLRFDLDLATSRLAQLDIPLGRKAGALSGGQQAQVALALALAKRPDLLVLDEPMASLDPLARREFLQAVVGAVADDGITVLFSSHMVTELERVCDHLVLLTHGHVTLTGDIEALLSSHRLLVGPRTTTSLDQARTVIEATHGDRHTTLLVRDHGALAAPGWQPHPVSLEDLVLAYLRRSASNSTAHAPKLSEVTA